MAKVFHWWHHKYDCISPFYRDYIREYRTWTKMIDRCYRVTDNQRASYQNYGARGIKVCDRWLDKETGFIKFYNDMGKIPTDKNGNFLTLDRIDPNGDYCPENCRWADNRTQCMNRRSTKLIYLWGEPYSLSEAGRIFGVKRSTLTERVRRSKMTPENALIKSLVNELGGVETERRLELCAQ